MMGAGDGPLPAEKRMDGVTRVVHINDNVPGAVYIGRANSRKRLAASRFANPFRVYGASPFGAGTDLASVIRQFRQYLTADGELLTRLPELRGKPLACWCRHDGEERTDANACHGDVIVELLARYTDDELRAMARRERGTEGERDDSV